MKIIDWERKGNLVRFFLGADDCTDYIREWTEKVARGEVTPCQGIIVSTTHIFPDHFGI